MDTFLKLDIRLQAGVISAVIGLFAGILGTWLKHTLDKRAITHKLEKEYEYEERKKLRELIGRFHGRTLEAAERLNHRLWNLQKNESKGWLSVGGIYNKPNENYYFTTTVHRFLSFIALGQLFESEAIFIDSRIAQKNDLLFLKFVKAFEWIVANLDIFDGLDMSHHDHFFRDKLRMICDFCIEECDFISLEKLQELLIQPNGMNSLKHVLVFFDGLSAKERRLRWDRMVCFHLLLMTFINVYGYDMQRSSLKQFEDIAKTVKNKQVLNNFILGLNKLGIAHENEVKNIQDAVRLVNKL